MNMKLFGSVCRLFLFCGLSLVFKLALGEETLDPEEYIEPWTHVTRGLFTPEDCQKIIDEAKRIGFPTYVDSIDYDSNERLPSLNLDVVDHGEGVKIPSIHKLYEPYLPIVNKLVSDSKIALSGDTSPPSLDWAFVRKYGADIDRNSLSSHNDVNLFTVNVALNDDYEGGGLLYMRPQRKHMLEGQPIPEFDDDDALVTGGSLAGIPRENSSRLVFPSMKTGDVFMHNFTVFHAVAPLEKGERYTLIFFYDMDHPEIDRYKDREVTVVLLNEFEEEVHLAFIDREHPDDDPELVEEDLPANYTFTANTNDKFEILSDETMEAVEVFEVPTDVEGDVIVITVGPDNEDEDVGDEDEDNEDDEDEDEEGEIEDEDDENGDEDEVDDEADRFDVTILHSYEDVDLYYVPDEEDEDEDENEGPERVLVHENLAKTQVLFCEDGDEFEVVHRKTGETLQRFQILEEHQDEELHIGPDDENDIYEGELPEEDEPLDDNAATEEPDL